MPAVIGRRGLSPSCHAYSGGGETGWAGRRRCSFGLLNGLVPGSFPRSWALAGDAAVDPDPVQLPLAGPPALRPPQRHLNQARLG